MSEVPQHLQALQIANDTRIKNANTRRRLEALPKEEACEEVARLLTTNESKAFEAMPADKLLRCIHRFGPGSARSALAAVGVHRVSKRVGELTPRQRVALAELLLARSAWKLSRQEQAA